MTMLKKLQIAYNDYMTKREEMDRIESEYDNDFMNDDLEAAFDDYYKNVYWPAYIEAKTLLGQVINNNDSNVLNAMLDGDRMKEIMSMTIV